MHSHISPPLQCLTSLWVIMLTNYFHYKDMLVFRSDVLVVRALDALLEAQFQYPSSTHNHLQLQYLETYAHFWPLQTPGTHMVPIHTQAKH